MTERIVRQDAISVFVRAGGYIYRPGSHERNGVDVAAYRLTVDTTVTPGQKISVSQVSGSLIARVGEEIWITR